MPNPYTLVFGQPPVEMIERTAQIDHIVSDFDSASPANYINLITGIRGSGKTVLITEIAKRLEKKKNWIVINLNPQRDLLTGLAARLNSIQSLNKIFREARINLSFLGIGLEIDTVPPITDIEDALFRMLHSIGKRGKKVLVTIDEVTNSKDMRIFASSYQLMLRERLPVFLLMTGLYKNIDSLKNADGMTFLERAPRTVLRSLDLDLIAQNYIRTLKAGQDKAQRLAAMTKGYSFAFQTIGYYAWEHPKSETNILRDAQNYLFEFAYHKIWSELSRKDREVIIAISKSKTSKIADIREQLHYSSNQFNPYRNRLLKAGIIECPSDGYIELALPFFDTYALQTRN